MENSLVLCKNQEKSRACSKLVRRVGIKAWILYTVLMGLFVFGN
jgi:hypothetical protein